MQNGKIWLCMFTLPVQDSNRKSHIISGCIPVPFGLLFSPHAGCSSFSAKILVTTDSLFGQKFIIGYNTSLCAFSIVGSLQLSIFSHPHLDFFYRSDSKVCFYL